MKTLYLECNMGAAGDMLTAALLELHPNKEDFLYRLNMAGIPNTVISAEPSVKRGVTGTYMRVLVDGIEEGITYNYSHEHAPNQEHHNHNSELAAHHHEHRGMADIEAIIESLKIPTKVKNHVLSVYNLIAEAESRVHAVPVDIIHFHEVGAMDAVADITGVCMLIDELAPDKIIVSPVNVGSGYVKCSHGLMPVPAPATSLLLEGVPIYSTGREKGELCTPTGAALLKYFATEFGVMPTIRFEKIGYGMGKKDFDTINCVRAILGSEDGSDDKIAELCCNIDDMTGEQIGYATQLLIESGALDVYTTPVQMKKNRPGVILTCLCRVQDKDKMLRLIFHHTKTLGIREYMCRRYVLHREIVKINTEYGPVRVKKARGWGIQRSKPEYEDLAKIAIENRISILEAEAKAKHFN